MENVFGIEYLDLVAKRCALVRFIHIFSNARSLLIFLKWKRYVPFKIERWLELKDLCPGKYRSGFLFTFILCWPVRMRWIAVRRSFHIIGHIIVNYFIFIVIRIIICCIQIRWMMNWWWFYYRCWWASRGRCIFSCICRWAICKIIKQYNRFTRRFSLIEH